MPRNTLTINDLIISNQKQDYQIKERPNYACSSRKYYTYIKKFKEEVFKKMCHVEMNQKKSEVLIPEAKDKFQNKECYQ